MAKRSKRKSTPPPPRPAKTDVLSTDLVLPDWTLSLLQALLITLAGCWVCSPALHGGWIRDDNFYLSDALMNDPARLWKAWFQPGSFIEYYPLTETVQWLQWKAWAHHPFGYHFTNVLLHIVNALLVWRLLDKLGLRAAWLGGLIFAVHPAQVESVAWISELKNTLSLAPFLLAMTAWIDYEENKRKEDYWLALGLFLVAMLCKITMAPFPVMILFYAWWRRGRIDVGDLKACAPFLIISLLLGITNILAGAWYTQLHASSPLTEESRDSLSRLALAGTCLSFYFAKFFWPGTILPIYPQWPIEPLTAFEFLPWLVLAGIIYLLWMRRQSWGRHALLGIGFFLIFLAPFLGFVTVSYMKFTWVMDHFLYLPMIGLIGLVVAAIGDVDARLSLSVRPVIRGLVTALITLMAFQAHAYSGAYINELTLWDYTLESTPGSWGARAGLADALVVAGKYPEAIRQYEIVLALRPDDPDNHYSLALILARAQKMPEAIREFEETLKLNPHFAGGHNNMGFALAQMGRTPEAIQQYEIALALRPNDAEIHYNLAVALAKSGRAPEAVAEFEQALRLKPDYPNANNNLGFVLGQMGRFPEAIAQLELALQLDPDNAKIRENLDHLQALEKAAPGKN